jgi:uncharacterized pyridoxal phosphate-containing UPF0001 family protein
VKYAYYISILEPKNIKETLTYEHWIIMIHEGLQQFERNYVWKLVPKPKDVNVIQTKWKFQSKTNELGNITKNKARLVAQDFAQVEGIDFD